jgi:hypothetical protein
MKDPYPRSRKLDERIDDFIRDGNVSAERLKELRLQLADTAMEEGWLCLTRDIFVEFDQRDKLRTLAEKIMGNNDIHGAIRAYGYLGDREKLLEAYESTGSEDYKKLALEFYFGEESLVRFDQSFDRWCSELGYPKVAKQESLKLLGMASELADKYDLGIGIAKGGLYLTSVFNQFGLDTKVVEAHRRGKGATFNWVSDYTLKEIEGKKILVIDKDVVSGRSSKKVLTELLKYRPQEVSLALTHNAVRGSHSLGSFVFNVDERYNNTYTPEDFTATIPAIKKFDEILNK